MINQFQSIPLLSNQFNYTKSLNKMADKKISIKIDVTKIVKEKLFTGKNGAKYLDATVYLKDTPDQYGNSGMITQDKTANGDNKNVILGNVKVWDNNSGTKANASANTATEVPAEEVDDLPF